MQKPTWMNANWSLSDSGLEVLVAGDCLACLVSGFVVACPLNFRLSLSSLMSINALRRASLSAILSFLRSLAMRSNFFFCISLVTWSSFCLFSIYKMSGKDGQHISTGEPSYRDLWLRRKRTRRWNWPWKVQLAHGWSRRPRRVQDPKVLHG